MDEPAMNDLVNRTNKRKFPENEAIIDAHLIYVPSNKRLKRKPDKRKASNDELPAAFKRRRLDAPVRDNDQVSEEPAFDVDGDEAATCDEHEEEPKAPPKKRKRKKDESTTPKGRTRLSLPRKVKLPNLASPLRFNYQSLFHVCHGVAIVSHVSTVAWGLSNAKASDSRSLISFAMDSWRSK